MSHRYASLVEHICRVVYRRADNRALAWSPDDLLRRVIAMRAELDAARAEIMRLRAQLARARKPERRPG